MNNKVHEAAFNAQYFSLQEFPMNKDRWIREHKQRMATFRSAFFVWLLILVIFVITGLNMV